MDNIADLIQMLSSNKEEKSDDEVDEEAMRKNTNYLIEIV